jgi:cytoskeletal protein CcmA (bactofilin family)
MAREVVNNTGSTHNALTYGSKIIGNIVADKDFRIDGEVQGDIVCKGKVVVGQTGYLKGTISCVSAEIVGSVAGDLLVSDTLTLRSTGNITGEVKTKTLIVEPGAVFNGSCSMKEKDANTTK